MLTEHTTCSQSNGVTGNCCIKVSKREPASRSASEPESASLRKLRVASLPEMVKPVTRSEEMFKSKTVALRGERGQRVGKAELGRLGDPPCSVNRAKVRRETITVLLTRGKSEEPIRARRRGNTRGAKGLWSKRSGLRRKES